MQTRRVRLADRPIVSSLRSASRRLAVCVVPAAVLACATQSALAFEFFSPGGVTLRWGDQNLSTPGTIDIFYDYRNIGVHANVATTVHKSLFEQALSDWSAVTNGKLVFTQSTTRDTDDIMNLSVGDLAALNGSSGPGGTLGIGSPNYQGNGTIVFASVQMDHLENWDLLVANGNAPPVGGSLPPDFYSVAFHEIGHALGLNHEDEPFSNMMASSYRGEKLGPSADDILGMSTLYSGTPNYNAVSRTLSSFNVANPPGHFNYFSGNPSVFSYWTDAGTTTVDGATQVQDNGEFHQAGGVWTTDSLVVGGTFSRGLVAISGGSFTANSVSVNVGTLSLSGGLLQTRSLSVANGTAFNWTGGTLSLTPGNSQPTLSGISNLSVPVAGTLKTAGGHLLTSLTVQGRAQLLPNGATKTVSRVNTLTIGGSSNAWTGQLDLTSSALVVQASGDKAARIATLQNQIASGRNGGAWTGNGITSSTLPGAPDMSLALADNADLQLSSYRGLSGLNNDSIILVVARNGDATLDEKVDAFDLNIVAGHWQQGSGALWSSGDFTGDGKVDAFDLNVLAANWQFGSGGSLMAALAAFPQLAGVQVPEPASLAVLGLGIVGLVGRRRRR